MLGINCKHRIWHSLLYCLGNILDVISGKGKMVCTLARQARVPGSIPSRITVFRKFSANQIVREAVEIHFPFFHVFNLCAYWLYYHCAQAGVVGLPVGAFFRLVCRRFHLLAVFLFMANAFRITERGKIISKHKTTTIAVGNRFVLLAKVSSKLSVVVIATKV